MTGGSNHVVTGGLTGGLLASTEILAQEAAQWVYSGPLPSARDGLVAATLGDRLIITGELWFI